MAGLKKKIIFNLAGAGGSFSLGYVLVLAEGKLDYPWVDITNIFWIAAMVASIVFIVIGFYYLGKYLGD